MINNVIMGMIRIFLERQALKFGKAIDWAMVKSDLDARIRKLVPGDYYDDAAALVTGTIIDLIASYFQTAVLPDVAGDAMTKTLDQAFTVAQNGVLRAIAIKAMSAK